MWFLKPKINGYIGFFGLVDWWLETFDTNERKSIVNLYPKEDSIFGTSRHELIKEKILFTSLTKLGFLSGLATTLLSNKTTRDLGWRVAKTVENYSDNLSSKEILDLHFFYHNLLDIFYRLREKEPEALSIAIEACKSQIQLSEKAAKAYKIENPEDDEDFLPGHKGFQQLTIIYDKQGKFEEAIEVAKQAQEHGWAGDWERRIERYKKKIEKRNN